MAPRIIPGGGIGDGPITDVANVYAIDDATRLPVAGAAVTVGTVTGTTDATGLFIAHGVSGKQDVLVQATGYRAEMWLGANGANITLDLKLATDPTPASATISGSILGFDALTVADGHAKVGVVIYSQDDTVSDAENNLVSPNKANQCVVAAGAADQSCHFTVTTRPGAIALGAIVVDADAGGGITLLGWAARTGVTATAGSASTGQDLTMLGAQDVTTETVAFGTTPSGLPMVGAIIGLELGDSGVLQLPSLVAPTAPTLLVPKLSALTGSTYRLTGIAKASATDPTQESVVLVRGQTGTTLSASTWIAPPLGVTVTRTLATWSPSTGSTVSSVELKQGANDILNATALDDRTTFDIPAAVTLPSGAITATVSSIGGAIDVTNFSLDQDRDKINAIGEAPATVD